ncbi:MAG TPA: AsnC family transcriptional regulator [Candidatus Bilamarchaeum sp.]|nr:AsnC family transcriptional regulator [Candidatus Bilamarchaeum sp.]
MDEIDRKIIELLKEDASTPLSKIADEIGVPRPTVYLRFNKMKEDGIIKGFNIVLSRESSGKRKAAVLRIKDYLLSDMGPRALRNVGERLSRRTEVVFAAKVSRNEILAIWEGDSFDPEQYDEVVEVLYVDPEIYKGV